VIYESMTRLYVGPWVVRVWRTETELQVFYRNDDLVKAGRLLNLQYTMYSNGWPDYDWKPGKPIIDWSMKFVAEEFAKFDRVSALEVTEKTSGCGVVIYVEWP